jgi:hypothetical protein
LTLFSDDCFLKDEKAAVNKTVEEFWNHYEIKRIQEITNYIGCKIRRESENVLLSKPNLIKTMLKRFHERLSNSMEYETPTRLSKVMYLKNEDTKFTKSNQEEKLSCVKSLFYLLNNQEQKFLVL